MITIEMRNYRNFLVQHENDLLTGKFNIKNKGEWQNWYNDLLNLQKLRKQFKTTDEEEMNKYLKDTDNYLNSLLSIIEWEINYEEKNNVGITDENIGIFFQRISILANYYSIKRKLEILEAIAKKEKNSLDSVTFVNNFGVTNSIPKNFANTYENLLLRQIDINLQFNEIINQAILREENIPENILLPSLFNVNFFHTLSLENKKNYLERLIRKIIDTDAKNKVTVSYLDNDYKIPRFYKALFLELVIQVELIKARILKREENLINDSEINSYDSKISNYKEVKDLRNYRIPHLNLKIENSAEVTAKLVDIIERLKELGQFSDSKNSNKVIVYKDAEDVYYVLKEKEKEFLKLYFLRKNLEKDTKIMDEVKNRLEFLKDLPMNSEIAKEIGRLTLILKEKKEQEKEEFKNRLKPYLIDFTEEEQDYYLKVLLNINSFAHSKKINNQLKIKILNTILNCLPLKEIKIIREINRYLNYLNYKENKVILISDLKKIKNLEKFSSNFNKSKDFIASSIINLKTINVKDDNGLVNKLENELDLIMNDAKKLINKAHDLQENYIDSSLVNKFLERRNIKEIDALAQEENFINFKDNWGSAN